VPPHYLIINIALYVSNVKLKIFFVDCKTGSILMKKEIVSPNPSTFKTYYSDPYYCILYGRAKLLLLDVRQIINGSGNDF